MLRIITISICLFYLTGCKTDSPLKTVLEEKISPLTLPAHFPAPVYQFEENERTVAGFALGKKLFYDPILSIDNTVSCGSCHQQFTAFAQKDHAISHGIEGKFGTRNSPGLFNLLWQKEFFWDGGSKHIELQPIGPITNPVEMGESITGVINKLNKSDVYKGLFKKAFNVDTANSKLMLKALAQFMGSIISDKSKYDTYLSGKDAGVLTEEEKAGMEVFKNKCSTCHSGVLFTDLSYRNNGLDDLFTDSGRYVITKNTDDIGKFKVPSLRNVELTGPYMHDGRYNTLEEVMDHYNSRIKNSNTLDPYLRFGISLNNDEKVKIITFLKTLTDNNFTKDKQFSEQN